MAYNKEEQQKLVDFMVKKKQEYSELLGVK